ncbi:MAG TPA: DUF3667 domain-containing protein [Chitinophagaceae bacterium]|nr:DUF3667 domain-containing protein [Chitinophagaceae bacterium]
MQHQCLNCNSSFTGNFCNNCGQSKRVQQFTFSHIISEFFHAFTHADRGFLTLFKKICLYPGEVAYEYIIEGKRKKYFNLFTFFLIIITISIFFDARVNALLKELFNNKDQYGPLFIVYRKFLVLVSIPTLAFFMWLIHSAKRKLLFSEYTVFAMVLYTLYYITDLALNLAWLIYAGITKKGLSLTTNIVYPSLLILYLAYTCYQFHQKFKGSNWYLSLLTGFAFIGVYIGISTLFVWAVINKFQGLGTFYSFGIRIS